MTTAVALDLEILAHALGVDVKDTADGLHAGELGAWFPGRRTIHLRPGLGPLNRTETLAHELGHVALRHLPGAPAHLRARQEREADEWAAKILISSADYERAERLVGHHEGALAHELGVTTNLIRVWRGLYERTQS